MCFLRVFWTTLNPFGEPTGAPRGAQGSHFKSLWGDKWKCETYAAVDAQSLLLRLEGVLRNLICITSCPLVLSMRFGRHFLPKVADLDSHRGPCGCPFGALLAYFWGPVSGSDFRSDFVLLLGGAGGRGGVPVASKSAESEEDLHTPGYPCGVWRILRLRPCRRPPLYNNYWMFGFRGYIWFVDAWKW